MKRLHGMVGRPPWAAAGPLAGLCRCSPGGPEAGQGAGCGPGGPPHKPLSGDCATGALLLCLLASILTAAPRSPARLSVLPQNPLIFGKGARQPLVAIAQYS